MSGNILDGSGRPINTLRISITDRCNLRCFYCYDNNLFHSSNCSPISSGEIINLAQIFVKLGISKIKITGGEPLVRQDVTLIIENISRIPFLSDVSLTTNGVLLKFLAKDLRKAGLKRVNISLDTLERKKFEKITGADRFCDVIDGIESVLNLDFLEVKVNVVVMRGINDGEINNFLEWAQEKNIIVRFIEFMPVCNKLQQWHRYFVSRDEILSKITTKNMRKEAIVNFSAGGPAEYFRSSANSLFGIISAVSHPFCFRCNRIRIDSTGNLFLCLYDERSFNLKYLVHSKSDSEILKILRKIILSKRGSFNPVLTKTCNSYFPSMCSIGG